jgi:hypothetical protein
MWSGFVKGNRLFHRKVQIIVKISNWDCGCSVR